MKRNTVCALRIILFATIVLLVIAYLTVPVLNSQVNRIFMIFSSMSVDNVMGFIRSYGMYAVAVSFALMVFQSIAAPLPAFLLFFANAAIWGWWRGAILSWSSALVGALVCFYIARILGRGAVKKLTEMHTKGGIDSFFDRYGGNTILVCRLLPFVSFDIVSYVAGLTATRFLPFLVATGIGLLPITLAYSCVGKTLTGNVKTFVTVSMVVLALIALAYLFMRIRNNRRNDSKACEDTAGNVS